MSGLNIYSYVDYADIKFYRAQKALAKRMDILDWIPGAYVEEIVQGGENPLDMARRISMDENAMRAPLQMPQPLIELHPGNPCLTAGGEVVGREEEEEVEDQDRMEEDAWEGGTGFTQESEAPLKKKAMRVATPQSKLVPTLTVDDARDMFSRDATAAFRERRRMKGKKLYGDYAGEETIAISSEDEDDRELAKRLRSDPPSPSAFAGMVRVKPEVLTVEEANEKMLRDEEQRVRMQKAAAEEPSVRNEVAELRALLLEQSRQRAVPQPPSSAELITQVIQGMLAQGLVMAPPSAFPHLPAGFPPQNINPPSVSQQSFSFGQMLQHQVRPYAPVQQVDDPNIWRSSGASRPLTPPPLRPPITVPPHHHRDDPHMFGSADPNSATLAGSQSEAGGFGSTDPNPASHAASLSDSQAGGFGSTDPNPDPAQGAEDEAMQDAEGPQGPGEASTPNSLDDPMHDEHAEVGLRPSIDNQPLQEQVDADVARAVAGDRGGAPHAVATSAASRPDQGEVTH